MSWLLGRLLRWCWHRALRGMRWGWRGSLALLQRRCGHPPESVVADILEGEDLDRPLQWCRICGAYRLGYTTLFRRPEPRWAPEP